MNEVKGELAKLSYASPAGTFAVGVLTDDTVIVGAIAHASPGQRVTLNGNWVDHPVFGRQFKVSQCRVESPQSPQSLIRYLSKGKFSGIGPAMAEKMVSRFGMKTLTILSEKPKALLSVPGIGPKTLAKISASWKANQSKHDARLAMSNLGLGFGLIQKLEGHYGDLALNMIQNDPYRICRDIHGVGFLTCDQIAMAQGLKPDAPKRAEAALMHAMMEVEGQGHSYATYADIFFHAEKLSVPIGSMDAAIQRLRGSELADSDPSAARIHRSATLKAEQRIAKNLLQKKNLSIAKGLFTKHSVDLNAIQAKLGITLNPEQCDAILSMLHNGLTIITGGPGTGKTTIVKAALSAAELRGESWALAAPTGRAAKRMNESTRASATTLHRLLGFSGRQKGFRLNAENPIDADALLIDEASMLDIWLLDSTLQALPSKTRLVLIGDVDQLPSIGPGQILRDVIASGQAEVKALKTVYRQALDANIVLNAHRIRSGLTPISVEKDSHASKKQDFFLISRKDMDSCIVTLLEIVENRLKRFGLEPRKDLQVLSPMRGGILGVDRLNTELQIALNPWATKRNGGLQKGDRIMQTKNDHENGLYNGDIGWVINTDTDTIEIEVDGRRLQRKGSQRADLELAYATTIHKSQGSEYPAVILVLSKSQAIMLKKNLLYTAVTRAKHFCCIIEEGEAINMALSQKKAQNRQTLLRFLLQENEKQE